MARLHAAAEVADAVRPWRWLGVAATLLAGLAWWAGRDDAVSPDAQPVAYRSPLGHYPDLPAAADVAITPSVVASVTDPQPAASCSGQAFVLWLDGRAQLQCIGPLRGVQSGSLRSYRAEAMGAVGRWLRIDIAGGELVEVAVGREAQAEFGCAAADCVGLSLGAINLRGERALTIDGMRLTRRGDAAEGLSDTGTALSGQLLAENEGAAEGTGACARPELVIGQSGTSTSLGFCANEGVAVEEADDGGRIHRFAGLDAPPIVVTTGADGRLLQIALGTLSCSGAQCAGAALAFGGAGEPLDLSLSGTVLSSADGRSAWASLNGRLRAP